jgi:hypothetical protein
MIETAPDSDLASQLLRIAYDSDLRRTLYERLGDYCHQCRNRLNGLKLGLYLASKQSSVTTSSTWSEVESLYERLERRVDQIQTLCRPMTLSRVTLGIDLLVQDRLEGWTRLMESNDRTLEIVAPVERAIASFDVERMGQVLDMLVAWRASESEWTDSARLQWWVDSSSAHISWEESRSGAPAEVAPGRVAEVNWTLPLLARVALAHGGDYRLKEDKDWTLVISWPSSPPSL